MTKRVRIENADTSANEIVVQTWQKGGKSSDGDHPDYMVKEEKLQNPTAMCEGWVWGEQYLVIKEV